MRINKTKYQPRRKLRNMAFKLENTHSQSFKVHKISIEETENELKTTSSGCSAGADNIPTELTKPVESYNGTPVIMNNFIQNEKYPDAWSIARISSIPKIWAPESLSDYRTISILPRLSKIYEKLVLKQTVQFHRKPQIM